MRPNTKPAHWGFRNPSAGTKKAPEAFQTISASEYRGLLEQLPTRPGATRRETPEEDLQMACAAWLFEMELEFPDLAFMFHSPNGGARSKRTRGRLKAMGTRRGVPDWLLPLPRGAFTGLAIEMKSSSGTLSEKQRAWLTRLAKAGYLTGSARTVDEFKGLVLRYLGAASRASAS